MALGTPTLKIANQSNTDATSYTTASGDATDASLQVLAVATMVASGTAALPALSGGGVTTWTQEETILHSSDIRRVTVFRALQAVYGAAAAVVIDCGGATQTGCIWHWWEISGSNQEIVQSVTNTGTGTSGTVTLAAFDDALNVGIQHVYHRAAENTTPGSETELADTVITSPNGNLYTKYRVNHQAFSTAWATSSDWGTIGLEIGEVDAPAAAKPKTLMTMGVG